MPLADRAARGIAQAQCSGAPQGSNTAGAVATGARAGYFFLASVFARRV